MIEIVINAKEKILTDEIKKQMVSELNRLLAPFIDENNITTLQKIIIADDFSKEITIFQQENNLPVEYTNYDGGRAFAKTFKIDNYGHIIFFDKDILARVFLSDAVGISLFFHELSHVYYNQIIGNEHKSMLKLLEMSPYIKDNLDAFSYILWEEYFVSRKLVEYYPNALDDDMRFLMSHYETTEKILREEVLIYKSDKDIKRIYGVARDRIVLLATYIAYPLGMVSGIHANYDNFSRDKYENMIKSKSSKIYDIWMALDKSFNLLYGEFPKLNGVSDILTDITNQCLKLYECFGIYIDVTDDNRMTLEVE